MKWLCLSTSDEREGQEFDQGEIYGRHIYYDANRL